MKYNLLLWIFLLCAGVSLQLHASMDYGLYFKSHSVPGTERTSLVLNGGKTFAVEESFKVEFEMWVRQEPMFGGILHLSTNDNQFFHFVFAAGEHNRNFPALVCDDGMFVIDVPIEREMWLPVSLCFHIGNNTVDLSCGKRDTVLTVPLHNASEFVAAFGRDSHFSSDVAPVNLRDVKVAVDGELVRHWKLCRHNGDTCVDEVAHEPAVAGNPKWLIDSHIAWTRIYSEKVSGRLDMAFNARDAIFYMVKPGLIKMLDGVTGKVTERPIIKGHPAVNYPGHVVYDTLTNRIFSYSLDERFSSSLSLEEGGWSQYRRHVDEPRFYNHARAFNAQDSSFYFFGGYGYYQYRNELFSLNVNTGRVSQVNYAPLLEPRYQSAAGMVGNTLYVFGGRGNKQGRQEFAAYPNHELCAIDLDTGVSRVLWRKRQSKDMSLMASSMYFDSADSSFYAVSMKNGGVLWKIFLNDSVWETVSRPIENIIEYQDCDFGFYYAPSHRKFYLVLDKVLSDRSHDLSIYSISTPLLSEAEISQQTDGGFFFSCLWLKCGGVLLLIAAVVCVVIHRKKRLGLEHETELLGNNVTGTELAVQPELETEGRFESAEEIVLCKYFNRSRSSILMLGTFSVFDKEGNNITAEFTPRLKNLLILLILYSERTRQGILWRRASGILWPDKEGKSARNNFSVALRRLRMMLERVGDVEVVAENGFFHIEMGEDVFCDYHVIFDCFRHFNKEKAHDGMKMCAKDDEQLNKMLEILLYGPLLSNTILDWLDEFKDEYSSRAIDLLRSLLNAWRGDDDMVLSITHIMFLHDPLSEEALVARCAVLFKQGKIGLAKSMYNRFCKEYKESLGEDYQKTLSDLLEY